MCVWFWYAGAVPRSRQSGRVQISPETQHGDVCLDCKIVWLAKVRIRGFWTQKVIMFEAVCLFRGSVWSHSATYMSQNRLSTMPGHHQGNRVSHSGGLWRPPYLNHLLYWSYHQWPSEAGAGAGPCYADCGCVCEIHVSRYLTYFQLGIIIDLNTCQRWIQLWKYMKHLRRLQGWG